MDRNILEIFDQSLLMALTVIFMLMGIIFQLSVGFYFQKLMRDTDTVFGADSKILKRCRERFVKCYKMNGGVGNISVFVDKYINRIRLFGMSISFIRHLSGQLMLAGVFMAGLGVCKGIIEGITFMSLLPFYIVSLFGIYIYLSVTSLVDAPARRKMLKTNLTDYLENHVAQRLEQGIMEKERLMRELSQETKLQKKEQRDNTSTRVSLNDENTDEDKSQDIYVQTPYKKVSFSKEEAMELEELLHNFISAP